MVVLGWIALFFTVACLRGRHSDSTPDGRCVPLSCSRLPCFPYGASSIPDSNYNSRCTDSHEPVAKSWLVVGTQTGSSGAVCTQSSGYRRRCEFSSHLVRSFVRLVRLVCNRRVESIVLPHRSFDFPCFFGYQVFLLTGLQHWSFPRTRFWRRVDVRTTHNNNCQNLVRIMSNKYQVVHKP